MSKKCHFWTLLFILFITSINANAQQFEEMMSRGQIKGNFQFESQFYREDTIIGAEEVPERIRSNGFLNLIYTNGGFSAGMRYESYLPPLLGYPEGYQGNGIMYRFASYQKDDLSITVGNFYEQFGTGLVLRTYERSEEHTSELQSRENLVCRLLLEKKKLKSTSRAN